MPTELKNGKAYQNSLIGLPLGVSCLPKSEVEQFEFFQDPSRYPSNYHDNTQERLSLVSCYRVLISFGNIISFESYFQKKYVMHMKILIRYYFSASNSNSKEYAQFFYYNSS